MRLKMFAGLSLAALLLTVPLTSGWLAASPLGAPIAIAQSPNAMQQAAELETQGRKLLERGRYAEGIATLERSRALYRQLNEPDGLSTVEDYLGRGHLLKGDPKRAIALWTGLIERAQARNGSVNLVVLTNLALAFYETGDFQRAEKALTLTLNQWDKLRAAETRDRARITLFEQQAHAYRLMQKVLVAQNRPDEALVWAERSRARALVALMAVRNDAQGNFAAPSLSEIQQIAKAQNSTLVVYSPVGREARVLGIEPRTVTDLYIWVVPPSGRIAFRQVALKSLQIESLQQAVLNIRENAIGVRGRGLGAVARQGDRDRARSSQTELRRLHQLLIAPIADLLPTDPAARVTFIPQGALYLVPFAALQDASGTYLIQQHTILTAPSAQVLGITRQLRQRQQAKPTAQGALIVGNPTMPTLPATGQQPAQRLSPLPGAEQEARAIAPLFNTEPLIGDQATRQRVLAQMPQARIIHLATHGLLDVDANFNEFGQLVKDGVKTARDGNVFIQPGAVVITGNVTINGVPAELALAREKVVTFDVPGTIALAPAPGDAGFLSAKEILDLQLQAELVVLSACDTGRGRIAGEGVVGLSRSLIAAGVPTVIVSLWAVPDAPTAALMRQFYQNLEQTPDKAVALRQAMLTTLAQYPHPRDWAAFTLIGEAQ